MVYRGTNDSTLTLSLTSDEYNTTDYSLEISFQSDMDSDDPFTFDIVDFINKILEDDYNEQIDWNDTEIIFDSDLYCQSLIYG